MTEKDDRRKKLVDALLAVEEGQKGVRPYNFEFSVKAELLKGILIMIVWSVLFITTLLILKALFGLTL